PRQDEVTVGQSSSVADSDWISTRLSKNVAPPPISVSAEEVVPLTFDRPGDSLFQWMPVATATPGRTLPVRETRAWNEPRSLKTCAHWPSLRPRACASKVARSRVGSPAAARCLGLLANDECRNCGRGGLSSCSGYVAARAGRVRGSSSGRMYVGKGARPPAFIRSE